jgi:hypothetical protein
VRDEARPVRADPATGEFMIEKKEGLLVTENGSRLKSVIGEVL